MTIGLKELLDKADKKLVGAHPFIAAKARQVVQAAFKEGINVLITQGMRTIQEQNDLYAQGRTKPGKIVTKAKGGYSYHNFGLAFDIVLQNDDGSLNWNVSDQWKRVAQIAKDLGLEWGGDWTGFKDYPHFQFTFGLSLADLRAGKTPTDCPKEVAQSTSNGIIGQVRVTVDGLRIRTGPGTTYPKLDNAVKGRVYNVTANVKDWHEIIIDDKHKGWVFGNNGQFLELVR